MRPIDRGLAPRSYQQYGEAIEDLTTRIGEYCSYCERYIPVGLAVEHVLPKSLHPELETTWNNFLLGCTNCNSVKGAQAVEVNQFLWPDRDNTFLAIIYAKGGFVTLANNLNNEQAAKAQALLNLVGLQRHQASGWQRPARKDKRWQHRETVWAAAERCRELFERSGKSTEARELVLKFALSRGFFSIWMIIFEDYADVKRELIQLLPGTATYCFDPNGKPVNLPGAGI